MKFKLRDFDELSGCFLAWAKYYNFICCLDRT